MSFPIAGYSNSREDDVSQQAEHVRKARRQLPIAQHTDLTVHKERPCQTIRPIIFWP